MGRTKGKREVTICEGEQRMGEPEGGIEAFLEVEHAKGAPNIDWKTIHSMRGPKPKRATWYGLRCFEWCEWGGNRLQKNVDYVGLQLYPLFWNISSKIRPSFLYRSGPLFTKT